MASDDAGLAVLLPHECLQLLDTHLPKVGRLGIVSTGRPDVLPVNYAVVGGEVVFRTGLGEKLAVAVDGAPVAFEVDAIDQSWQEGWSVTATPSCCTTTPRSPSSASTLPSRGCPRNVPTTSRSCRTASPAGASTSAGPAAATSRPGPEPAAAAGQGPARTRDRQPGQR